MVSHLITRYVGGFMFNEQRTEVALVEKIKPSWQFGLLNAIGGKVEPGEEPLVAMCREFKEEAGIQTFPCDWEHVINLSGRDWEVDFFRGSTSELSHVKTMEEEEIHVVTVESLFANEQEVVPNLRWLVPLILDDRVHFPMTVLSN